MSGDASDLSDLNMQGGGGVHASLLFAPHRRPDAAGVRRAAAEQAGFQISLDPPHTTPGGGNWLELVVNGMTFDLTGLAPGDPSPLPAGRLAPALMRMDDALEVEAITLQPGPHLAGGAGMVPVIRCLALLTAQLADLPALRAVAWHPAGQWALPQHFRSSVLGWIDGGVFPGLALASLIPLEDGGLQSRGLALFTGQELRLQPDMAGDPAEQVKLALRLMHWLVDRGGVTQDEALTGPNGERLIVRPGADGMAIVGQG